MKPALTLAACFAVMVAVAVLSYGCSSERCFYRYDGNTAPGARPFYKACLRGDKLTVQCDSANRLPNEECR